MTNIADNSFGSMRYKRTNARNKYLKICKISALLTKNAIYALHYNCSILLCLTNALLYICSIHIHIKNLNYLKLQ